MSVGSLVVSLSANIAQFASAMDRASALAEERMRRIDDAFGLVKTSLASLGGGFLAGLTLDKLKESVDGAIELAASLQEMSEKTGATVEKLAGLAAVAKLSNTDTEALSTGMQKLAKNMVDAQDGGAKTSEAFKAIGISMRDLKGLKPDEAFQLIAQRMDTYADGADKVAVAQALLGKAGADLLPVMKDLVNAGDLQYSVTKEQAEQADQYEKTVRRLQLAEETLFQTVVGQLLPVLNAFSKAMLESATSTSGVKGAVDDLAKNNTIRDWAETAAMGVATVSEAVLGLAKLVRALGGSFEAVWADAKLLGQNANPFLLTKNVVTGQFKEQLAERNKVVEEANQRYKDLWNYDGTAMTRSLSARFAALNAGAGGGRGSSDDPRRLDHGGEKSTLTFHPNAVANDPGKAFMEGQIKLGEQMVAEIQKRFQTSEGFVKQFYSLQLIDATSYYASERNLIQDSLARQMKAYDQEEAAVRAYAATHWKANERQDAANKLADIAQKKLAAQADATDKLAKVEMEEFAAKVQFQQQTNNLVYQWGLQNDAAKFQLDVLGKTTLEVQKLTAVRNVDLQVQKQIYDAQQKGLSADQLQTQIADLVAKGEAQKSAAVDQVTKAYEKQISVGFGVSEAFRKYSEEAANLGAQIENSITNALKGLEDALVQFVTTGKLNFKSLADSIISDIARIIIKEQVIKPITDYLGNASSGGGGLGSIFSAVIGGISGGSGGSGAVPFGGTYADGGYLEPGHWGIAGEVGPEMIFGGRTGVTVQPNGDGSRGQPIVIHNNFTVGDVATTAQLRAEVRNSERRMQAGLARAQQYGGGS